MSSFYSPSTGGLYQSSTYDSTAPSIGVVPSDSILITDEEYDTLSSGIMSGQVIVNTAGVLTLGTAPAPVITPQEQQLLNEVAIQNALDAMAQTRGYTDIKSACAYAAPAPVVPSSSPNFAQCEKFRIEGNALQIWMAETWAAAYAYIATVQAGTNPMPNATQAVSMMPTFTWPD